MLTGQPNLKIPVSMKTYFLLVCATLFITACTPGENAGENVAGIICNPINISYRFQLNEPSRREAADPTVILFHDVYYLFASKSGGYWFSDNLVDWTFVSTEEIPTEEYAPTVVEVKDTLYFLASSSTKSTIYRTADPKSGKWEIAKDSLDITVWDPALFLDEDNRLYLYWGCSNKNPIFGVELDYNHGFAPIGEVVPLIYGDPEQHGWEVPGNYNTTYANSPWIEGAWMNKYAGKYYLQYAGPGTEFKSYADGVYTSASPLGPFVVAPNNPFSYKPEGFAAGAGHGCTFRDRYGNYWHIATSTISVKHVFERRLMLFPAFFDEDEVLHAMTEFGDYPFEIPARKVESFEDIFPGWMLLSYHKKVDVSSSSFANPPSNMTDENIRTSWAAMSGDSTEWAQVDLGADYDVYAVQINFADDHTSVFGRLEGIGYRYVLETSSDKTSWSTLIDRSKEKKDDPHDFFVPGKSIKCRYLRIRNIEIPGGHFALSGFRVFGKGTGPAPAKIDSLQASRDPENLRSVKLNWNRINNATGYTISYGTQENKLYQNYMVYEDTTVTINTLDVNRPYYFTIHGFNENGTSQDGLVIESSLL